MKRKREKSKEKRKRKTIKEEKRRNLLTKMFHVEHQEKQK